MYLGIAVREGLEPSYCDSVKNKLAGFVVNPYSITYFVFSAHETSGCVCLCVHNFTTLQCAERQGFEPQNLLQLPVFKTGAFNHSAIFP